MTEDTVGLTVGLMAELQRRWRELFSQLRDGFDAPPGQRLRIEGMMEAVALLQSEGQEEGQGEGAQALLQRAMDDSYRQVTGHRLAEDFGADWRRFYPFPQVPVAARRAPVVPSTAD